ncbi:MAG: M1 family metallopeptidase [Bacteroidales bacterium]|nr:M1 family metallopeptidase [Bacteroidales bacterium]
MASKHLLCTIACLLEFCYVGAQQSDLFIPTNVQRAIALGTRGADGKPGPKYFQNRTDYDIKASFDPRTGVLTGSETVVLSNNSPDTLKALVVRLYQNIYNPEVMRQTPVEPADIGVAGVEVQQVSINGFDIPADKLRYVETNMIVPIPSKLNPKSSLTMDVSWKVNLPNNTLLRMGRYDSTSYFVAYWYPQIAVYDDIMGWSVDPYTGLYEFYNEYGNFDVRITLPKDYVAWATGELQNSQALFTDEINKRIDLAKKSDDVVRVITPGDYHSKKVLKASTENTWHFKANNVSDFAFGVSDHYIWDATSVEVDPKTKRRAMAGHVYKIDSKEGEGVAAIARRTIERLSTDLLGVPYPYPHNTIWEGDGGMEFPMMCNDGPADQLNFKVFVTSHEVSHSYFPFMVGTNEVLYGWIDEGLVTFIPKEIEKEYGNDNAHYYINAYSQRTMGSVNDIPLSVPTTHLNGSSYFMQNYGRAAIGFYFLHDMLGKEMFRKVFQEFIARWEGKHPTPTDLALTLNSVTAQDWSWYWNSWFYQTGYADLALDNVVVNGNQLSLDVRMKGQYPVPIKLLITFVDGSTEQIYHSALVWKNSREWSLKQSFAKPIRSVVLGDRDIPDAFTENNSYHVK